MRSRKHLPVVRDAQPAPPLRGYTILRGLERPFLAIERVVNQALPAQHNPLTQTGAIANTTFLIAIVSGVLLLFWHVPSVHQAYGSLEAMAKNPLVELVRSLHRYSSDACLLFIVWHALRYFAAGRFTGARWLAWVTGMVGLALMWLVGWLGYWLVWDQRAQQVALGTARMLDVLPIFVDPLSRSFLTDAGINSLLFFIVFFAHMLVPLLIGVALWLHITRLARPLFVTGRAMTTWVVISLVVISLIVPATSAEPAHMLSPPRGFTMDYWYLLPLVLTDRLSGGLLWLLAFLPGVGLLSLPWLLTKGRAQAAVVDPNRCNACNTCFQDCPYGAIEMVPRTDGRNQSTVAQVNPAKCVGCGVCAGSCNSSAIGIPRLSVVEMRHHMDAWLDATAKTGGDRLVAFACASSAAIDLHIDPDTGVCEELPGYRVWAVPCAGFVHALTVQRVFRHGGRGVLVIACGEGQCEFREGALTAERRMEGEQTPAVDRDKLNDGRVQVLRLSRNERHTLQERAAAFRNGPLPPAQPPRRAAQIASGIAVMSVIGAATVLASDAPYTLPPSHGPEVVVSFTHPGRSTDKCRKVSPEELAKLPIHMRRPEICDRSRASVRVRVSIDGQVKYEAAHAPSGIYADMNSIGVVRVPVAPGAHQVEVAIGDTHDPSEWSYVDQEPIQVVGNRHHVVVFDRTRGFQWF